MNFDIQKINDLPSINEIRIRSQGLALLDAIIMPQWEYRYFSFNSKWNVDDGEMMASMRDGSGAEYFILLSKHSAVGKVFDGQSRSDAKLLLEQLPNDFANFKNELAFKLDDVTFYFWRSVENNEWMVRPQNRNSYANLRFLLEDVTYYHKWAEEYYDRSIDLKVLQDVFNSLHITPQQLAMLNADLNIQNLYDDLREIFQ